MTKQNKNILDDNKHKRLSEGMSDYLMTCKNTAYRKLIMAPTTVEDVALAIEAYLQSLGDTEDDYTREQMIQDLIMLLKQGNAGVSKHLIDMLGFEKTDETFTINFINYGDIEEDEDIKEEE